jgi:hypothetical protein
VLGGCCATQRVYGGKEKFEAFLANQAPVGVPLTDAISRLTLCRILLRGLRGVTGSRSMVPSCCWSGS